MTDTPIIDTAAKAIMECDEDSAWDSIASADCRNAAIAALRAALPWEPSSEQLEAMRDAIWSCDEESAWDSIALADCRIAALAAYRAAPIMRELYPERFS